MMDVLERSIRIIFREILSKNGLECRSFDKYVCSFAYAYQPLLCVKYVGPFFLCCEDFNPVIKHPEYSSDIIINKNVKFYDQYSANEYYDRHRDPLKSGCVFCVDTPISYRCNNWKYVKFDISDPKMYDDMDNYISKTIKLYNINTTEDTSKLQQPIYCDYYRSVELSGLKNYHIVNIIGKDIILFPNVSWGLNNRIKYSTWFLDLIERLFFVFWKKKSPINSNSMINAIIRHTKCDFKTANKILQDAAMFDEFGFKYDTIDEHTSKIVAQK